MPIFDPHAPVIPVTPKPVTPPLFVPVATKPVVPPPVVPDLAPKEFSNRLVAVEALVNKHGVRLDALQLIPANFEARVTALEKLVRSHAETIGSVKTRP